jgi:hypothetical protein
MTVREWLLADKLSQKWLGERLNLSQQAISWALKHGFKAQYFSRIAKLSKGKITEQSLSRAAARRPLKRVA